jgi:hypothetical protein
MWFSSLTLLLYLSLSRLPPLLSTPTPTLLSTLPPLLTHPGTLPTLTYHISTIYHLSTFKALPNFVLLSITMLIVLQLVVMRVGEVLVGRWGKGVGVEEGGYARVVEGEERVVGGVVRVRAVGLIVWGLFLYGWGVGLPL